MIKEFESVPHGQYYKWDIGEKNKQKHRMDFVKAYDHSRVVLKVFADDMESNDYINSNWVDGYDLPRKFIATQGPIPSTINDFWRMIVDTNTGTIVTVTKLVEKNAINAKNEGEKKFGNISVTTVKNEKLPDLDIRYYKVKQHENVQDVIHFHFLGWPAYGIPTHPNQLLQLIYKVRKSPNISPLRPIVVLCGLGIGRTGTFMLLLNMIEMAEKSGTVDIYKYFAKMRTQRMDTVTTLDQYKFVYKSIAHHVK
ncbi:hypothetical protein B4U80_04713 [Leptotrombidium deliense]|uniref:Uncharacterized protein n=1 Tax=Leptotrombidium deliense TaxID=299467 RepID=A0A443S0L7_9ACAR|nr:hypothetical protein B4U80_04713 [Leptotrombidium deliense]